MQKQLMKSYAASILTQDFFQLINQAPDNKLKKAIVFDHVFPDEEVLVWMKKIFDKKYKYADSDDCIQLYKDFTENRKIESYFTKER
jgi:hypothetical protein